MAATLLTTAQVAEALKTDPKTLRKFLRADAREKGDTTPGKGGRWTIEAKKVTGLRSRFIKWTQAQEQAKLDREAAQAAKVTPAAPAEVDEVDEPSTDEEPTDEALEMLEDGDEVEA